MRSLIVFLLIIIVIGGAAYFFKSCESDWCLVTESQKAKAADSFERCVELGFPVMESFPRQCRAGDKNFTENVAIQPVQTDKIKVTAPLPGTLITSPVVVRGEARGNWYFEASFPMKLLDGNGKQIAIIPVQAQGEWMTTEFVPFETTLTFIVPETATGTLVLEKDNPSGLPEHDDSVSIPVRFR